MNFPANDCLVYLRDLAKIYGVEGISNVVLDNPKFPIWSGSGSPNKHHYGNGGLVIHTAEVVQLCIQNNYNIQSGIPYPSLFLAALFHDSGKMWDYEPIVEGSYVLPIDNTTKILGWTVSDHKNKIHHITRSALNWQEAVNTHGFDGNSDEILHAVLAHHGQKEWGSPVTPKTKLAWMLHLCDCLSARLDDCDKM